MDIFSHETIADRSFKIKCNAITSMDVLCYLVEGRDYALLIDTMMGFGDLKAYCSTLTDKPIKVVNTHAHSDHFLGNFAFGHCYMHHRDIVFFQMQTGFTKEQMYEAAKAMTPKEYYDTLTADDFSDGTPIAVYPLYDGDIFDLGDRKIEVVRVSGHTEGSIVLIDHSTRIAYSGDACNGNTLLDLPHCTTVQEYLEDLLRLKSRQSEFDMMYGGHEVFDSSVIDEGIETAARVVAGTDDHYERTENGRTSVYAAAKIENGYERKDGKRFNMSYFPDRIIKTQEKHIIK